LEHASEITGLNPGKIAILLGNGDQYDDWSFDEDLDIPDYPPMIEHGGYKYYMQSDGYVSQQGGEKRLLHRVLFEEKYGGIPAGKRVQFRNGDKYNVDIDNLYLT